MDGAQQSAILLHDAANAMRIGTASLPGVEPLATFIALGTQRDFGSMFVEPLGNTQQVTDWCFVCEPFCFGSVALEINVKVVGAIGKGCRQRFQGAAALIATAVDVVKVPPCVEPRIVVLPETSVVATAFVLDERITFEHGHISVGCLGVRALS